MTSSNRFVYDVVATDSSSAVTKQINAGINELTASLTGASAAYGKLADAQKKVKGSSSGRAGKSDAEREAESQARAEKKANDELQKRANLIRTSGDQEAAMLGRIDQARQRAFAARQRENAQLQASSGAKIAALDTEIARTRALAAVQQSTAEAARRTYATASRASVGGVGTAGTGAGDAKAAAAALKAYEQAARNAAAAEGDVSKAVKARNTAISQAKAATDAAAKSAQELANKQAGLTASGERVVISQNQIRYALYQVAAAYAAASKTALSAVKDVTGTAIAFEAAFAQVSRTTGLGSATRGVGLELGQTAKDAVSELGVLKQSLIDTSRQIPVAFGDLSSIASLGAQLGIASGSVGDFTEVVAKFTAQSNVTAEQTATYFGRLQNILEIPTSQFNNLGSAVAELGTKSVATESEILAVATQIGSMANSAGISSPYILGLSTALASVRVPPELARGTITGLLQNISRKSAEGAKGMEAFGRVLGVTGAQANELYKSDPDQFFSNFVQGLGQASDSGQNLIPILDDLGIKNRRDVPTVTKLAQSYKLLADYTGLAATSFASGTYLDESFKTIAETTQSSLTRMANSFAAFKDSVGQAILPLVKVLADGVNGVLTLFTTISNAVPGISGALIGVTAAVGVLLAVRSAAFLAAAAYKAMQVAQTGLSPSTLRAGSALRVMNAETSRAIPLTNALAGTQQRAAITTGELAVASTAAAGGIGLQAAATVPAAVRTGILATTANIATGAMARLAVAGRATAAALGPVGLAIVGIGLVAGLWSGLSSSADRAAQATKKAEEAQKALNQEWIDAGDGAEALHKAIAADTAAYEAAGNKATESNGVFMTFTDTVKELADGSKVASTSIRDSLGKQIDSVGERTIEGAKTFERFGSVVAQNVNPQEAVEQSIKTTNTAIDGQTTALGNATLAWEKNAYAAKLGEKFSTPELQQALIDFNKQNEGLLKQITDAAAGPGRGEAVKALIQPFIDKYVAERQAVDEALNKLLVEKDSIISGRSAFEGDEGQARVDQIYKEIAAYQAQNKALDDQNVFLSTLQTNATELGNAVKAANVQSIFNDILAGEVAIDDGLSDVGETADTTAAKVRDLGTAFSDLVNNAFGVSDLEGAVDAAFEALGTGLVENGRDFSNYTENGRKNLANLATLVDAYAAVQADALDKGQISATTAAQNVQSFVAQTIASLSDMGVDTTQVEFLQNYVNQLVAAPYTLQVGADTSSAINSINSLLVAAQSLNGALGGMARFFTGGKQSTPNMVSNGRPGQYVPAQRAPVDVSRGLASADRARQAAQAVADKEREAAATKRIEDAQKSLQDAQKATADGAKAAGDTAKQAADDASEALKQQEELVNATADAYKNLANAAFAGVKSEGDVFDSLQQLGKSFLENGKSFNTITESGRANYEALTEVFSNFGEVLSQQIKDGTISADQAQQKYKDFASGVYSELVGLGVPLTNIKGFFNEIGVSAEGWTGTGDDIKQYTGYIEANADAAARTAKELKEVTELAQQYTEALASFYSGLSDVIFAPLVNEGKVFEALQKLGIALDENGKSFNTNTASGRANIQAVADTISAYSDLMAAQVTDGTLTAAQAAEQLKQFAGGVYNELVSIGVPAREIDGILKGFGIDPKGFGAGNKAVSQFGGYIRTAYGEMVKLSDSLDIAAKKAKDFATVMEEVFNRKFGLQTAVDSVNTALNTMKQGYQDNIDKVKELQRANAGLKADLATAEVTKQQAQTEKDIAKRYGETDRVAGYDAKVKQADSDISDIKAQIGVNKKDIDTRKKGANQLKGNTQAAIENREELRGLTSQMIDQIQAYAETGASTKQVTEYTERLKKQFLDAGIAAGYTKKDLDKYTGTFDQYVDAIKKVPKTVNTEATTSGTSAATNALNSIPSGKRTLTTEAKASGVDTTKRALGAIPKKSQYTITAAVKKRTAEQDIARIPKTGSFVTTASFKMSDSTRASLNALQNLSSDYAIKPRVDQSSKQGALNEIGNFFGGATTHTVKLKLENGSVVGGSAGGYLRITYAEGGVIPQHYAKGGVIDGPSPRNRKLDNMIMPGPSGPVAVQGGEGVVNLRGMDAIGKEGLDAINGGLKGMAGGGYFGYANGGSGGNGPVEVELSPYDRGLLRLAGMNNPTVIVGGERVSSAASTGNARRNDRGDG